MPASSLGIRKKLVSLLEEEEKTSAALTVAVLHWLPPEYALRQHRRMRATQRTLRGVKTRRPQDLDSELWSAARYVVNAYLCRMKREGLAVKINGSWRLTGK